MGRRPSSPGRIRILAIAPNTAFSGAERVLGRYLRQAVAAGHDVTLLAPPGHGADLFRDAGIEVRALPDLAVPVGPRAAALARVAARWPAAARAVRRAARSADVVLVNGFPALPAVRLAVSAGGLPPVLWLVHDVIRRRDRLVQLRACAPAIDRAVAVSRAVAGPLEAVGIPTTVVRNGTVWPVEAARGTDGPPVVGVNAMLTSWKGQDVLLEAAARLAPEVRVELMGGQFPRDGEYVAGLRARATAPDLAGRVDFLGHVADPIGRLRTWTVAVSASVDPEAAPLNVLEAMSVGVPVVGTDHGGTPEVLGEAGLLVPPADPAAMADAVHRLLSDPVLRARCRDAGPRAIAAGLRVEDAAAAFLEVLTALVRSHDVPPTARSTA